MSVPLQIYDYEDYLAASSSNKAEQVIKLELASKKIDERLQEMRADLLEETRKQGVLSLKTEQYTITRSTRETLKISNNEAICQELEGMNVPILTERVLTKGSKDMLKLVIKEGKTFNNAEIQSTEYVSIKINN